ncbi:MAG: hypothetical protein IT544_00450 [Rhodobacteraceae bacterium]|nr:hypothetical protein [Paracoccaceae bacterium]
MCMYSNSTPQSAPQLPPDRAAMRSPDGRSVSTAGRRITDRMRAASSTILTSNNGVLQSGQTQGKTLLGQ